MSTRRLSALFLMLAALVACKHVERGPDPLLWSLEKDGKTSYAFGTFHMGVDPKTGVSDLVWNKLESEPAFAMETDIHDASLQRDMARADGKTLHDDLGDAYWKKLEAALTPQLAARLNGMQPAVAATVLSIKNLPHTAAMDTSLLERAQHASKQIAYLEPAQVQVKVLLHWMDVKGLEGMLDDLPFGESVAKDMLAAYQAGDEAKILQLSDAEHTEWTKLGRTEAEYGEMMDEMLYRRNASWIDQIEKLHSAGGVFIAVGAMHLCGPKSVLELLRAKGYTVTRVSP